MARVRCIDLSDICSALPEIMSLTKESLLSCEEDDLLICTLGFEPRCLSVLSFLEACSYHTRYAICLEYDSNRDDNEANQPELTRILTNISDSFRSVQVDSPDASAELQGVFSQISQGKRTGLPRVSMDISVSANRVILKCMKLLLECPFQVRIFYAEAKVYHPTKQEYDNKRAAWKQDDVLGLERGVANITPSQDWPGCHIDPLPDCIVIFPAFHGARSKAAISLVDPSLLIEPRDKVHWILGIPHLPEDDWRLEATQANNGLAIDTPNQHRLSTFDYRQTLNSIDSLYRSYSCEYRLTIAPMGSKFQALGVGLFCYMHPDVRIIISAPKEYNAKNYSEDHKALWQINFGSLDNLRATLDRVGNLEICD